MKTRPVARASRAPSTSSPARRNTDGPPVVRRRGISPRAANSVLVIALALLATPTGAAAAESCAPPGGHRSDEVVRGHQPNGDPELTERLDGGGYRVTRCDARGKVKIAQTVQPIPVPGGRTEYLAIEETEPLRDGELLTRFMRYPDARDPLWAENWKTERDATLARTLPVTGGRLEPAPGAEVPDEQTGGGNGNPGTGCNNITYGLNGRKWSLRMFTYHTYYPSLPGPQDQARSAIINGFNSWQNTINACNYSDGNNIIAMWAADATRPASASPDSYSVVDFGDMVSFGCTSSALACAYLFGAAPNATETDIRFRSGCLGQQEPKGCYTWKVSDSQLGSYDLWSVAAHEAGHSIGLTDLYGDAATSTIDELTMYGVASINTIHPRTLGAGDVLGMRRLYP